MRLLPLLLAPFLLLLASCSMMQPAKPAKIDPPPVLLTLPCLTPDDLKESSTAQDLAIWTLSWVATYWCERERREGLVEAWPK